MKKFFTQSCMVLALAGALLAANGCIGNSSTTGIDVDDGIGRLPEHTSDNDGKALVENTIRLCSDGIDNDGNGTADCDDPNCQFKGNDGVSGPGATVCGAENNEYTCDDGIDNDGNGYVDCKDRSCYGTFTCCPNSLPENTFEACTDGVDNDCNGYIDCNDNSCKKSTVQEIREYCEGKICGDKCVPLNGENTIELCSDGVDNDMNGYADCKDRNCETLPLCTGAILGDMNESGENCKDGSDNDLDGRVDCDDPDCADLQYCEGVVPETGARVSNFSQLSEEEKVKIYEEEYKLCTDKIDNDKNGKTDCEEYRCQVLSLTDLSALEKKYSKTLNINCDL